MSDTADTTASYDPIDIATAINKLDSLGFYADQIAMVLDKPVSLVRAVIKSAPAPEDKELGDEVRRLCLTAIRRAFYLLDYGTGEQKTRIIMACINGSTRMLQAATAATSNEVRVDFLNLMARMRDVPARETIVTGSGAIDVEARPAIERTEDQD